MTFNINYNSRYYSPIFNLIKSEPFRKACHSTNPRTRLGSTNSRIPEQLPAMLPVRFLCVIIVPLLTCVASECCWTSMTVMHTYKDGTHQLVKRCDDLTRLLGTWDYFCGVGKCNIFGCDCVGGCRKYTPGQKEPKYYL